MSCKDFVFTCELVNGLHARPATLLVKVAEEYDSRIELENTRNGHIANVKSVLSLLAADVNQDDVCRVRLTGNDAGEAMRGLRHYILRELPDEDKSVDDIVTAGSLPPSLRSLSLKVCRGLATATGWTKGKPVVAEKKHSLLSQERLPDSRLSQSKEIRSKKFLSKKHEKQLLLRAMEQLDLKLEDLVQQATLETERGIFKAHQALASDPEFKDYLTSRIDKGFTLGEGIGNTLQHFTQRLKNLENPWLKDRVTDIQDICDQLLRFAYELDDKEGIAEVGNDCIYFSESLSPSQLLALEKRQIKGVVLEMGGKTSHTVLLARAKGIPVIVGAEGARQLVEDAQEVLIDSRLGLIIAEPDEKVDRYYRQEDARAERLSKRREPYIDQIAQTLDGQRLEVGANIISGEESERAFRLGAEGIGLFRTEVLFMKSLKAPDIAEQKAVYRTVFEAAGGKPVIIRTVDIGGDKPVEYLGLPKESNPFLGYRAVRIYPEFQTLFENQVRAILEAGSEASLAGDAIEPMNLIIPMISTVGEVVWVRNQVDKIRADLEHEGERPIEVRLGVMLEVPSACLIIDQLSRYVDFFSIGSNDLAQYTLAADRGNRKLEKLYHYIHPSFLRLLKKITKDAQEQNRWVGLCGEMASDPQVLPLVAGLGLDEISMPVEGIPGIKETISRLDSRRCKTLLEQALNCEHAEEVAGLLQQFNDDSYDKSAFHTNIIQLDMDCLSKEEAIKALVDMLYVDGRIIDPAEVEETIWLREQQCSTGLGNGLATPHCLSNQIHINSVAVLRFSTAVDWNALDGQPVTTVFLLVARETGAPGGYMKLFASLARKLVSEGFISKVQQCPDADNLVCLLNNEVMQS